MEAEFSSSMHHETHELNEMGREIQRNSIDLQLIEDRLSRMTFNPFLKVVKIFVVCIHFLSQLPGNLLVQNFLQGERDDDGVVGFEEAVNLPQRVVAEIEADEEALVALAPAHGGFKGVNVRLARLVLLLHMNGIPAFFQGEIAFLERRRFRADGEDATINALVADLCFVFDAAEGDDGPILNFWLAH
jgi:hypothetical protein